MTLGKYLVLVLGNDAAIAALVAERIYSDVLPQKPRLPAIVFTVVTGSDDEALDGPTGAGYRRLQVDTWAEKRETATTLGLAVRAALAGHVGGAQGFEVQGISATALEQWDFDPDVKAFRVIRDFDVAVGGVEF